VLILCESRNIDLKKEALYVMTNGITGADLKLRGDIYDRTRGHIMKIMVDALPITETKLLLSTLDTIDDLLGLDEWFGTANTSESMLLKFEACGGLDNLDQVVKSPNMDVYNRANDLMLKYFEVVQ
jgi:hypothetical protein